MNYYTIFLIIFIITLSTFTFLDTKAGFKKAFGNLLRILVPIVLSGIIVKLVQLISKVELISYIVGGIGVIIFYIVLRASIKPQPTKEKLWILDYFLGFIIGLIRGWLYFGIIILYLNFFNIINFQKIISPVLFRTIIFPIRILLFLDFIKF